MSSLRPIMTVRLRGADPTGLLRSLPACCQRSQRRRALPVLPVTSVRYKSGPYGYTQAKALVFSKYGEPRDVLHLHAHSVSPSLPTDSVLLRSLAAPINPADVNTIQGSYGALPPFSALLGTAEPSTIPGGEGVLEVVSSTSPAFQKGDWAVPSGITPDGGPFGTWRTHALVPATALLKIEKAGLTPAQAATVSVNPCSAARMLRDFVPLPPGGWFLQNGANSGVGRAAAQLARAWGLRCVGVVRSRPTPAETEALRTELRDLGAAAVVTEDEFLDRGFPTRLRKEIMGGEDDGPGLRLGLNCVGGKSAQQVARCLDDGGTMVTYGAMAKQPVMLPTAQLIFKDLRFRGFWLSKANKADPEGKKKLIEEMLALIREGKLKDVPVQEVRWDWDTDVKVLTDAVQGTLEGFRKGKGLFVFGNT